MAGLPLLFTYSPAAAGQQIWFGPRTPNFKQPYVSDWSSLFSANPQWNKLAGQFQVFLAPIGFFLTASDDELRRVAANAAQHHIALAMPLQSIAQKPGEACDRTEGYGNPGDSTRLIDKLKGLGIQLQIIRLDGPIWFGHYTACKLPADEIARRVAQTLEPFIKAWPSIAVGDVEGPQGLSLYPDWQAQYKIFADDLSTMTGRKLQFLHADVDWRRPDWPSAIAAEAQFARAQKMQFGVIYDSDGLAPSDKAWDDAAKHSFDELETRYHLIPNQAVFQSWNQYPTRVFPETTDGAHSWLIAQYLLPRTTLKVQHTAHGVQGTLAQANGRPVAGAPVTVDALGTAPNTPPPVRTVDGTVPAKAHFIIIGLRVNADCWCTASNNLLVGPLSFRETSGGNAAYTEFPGRLPPTARGGVKLSRPEIAGHAYIHAEVPAGTPWGFLSAPLAVTPGAQFEFKAPIGTLDGKGMAGQATVMYFGADKHSIPGVARTNISVESESTPVTTATTDANGRFSVTLPAADLKRPLLVRYAGSGTLRAAYASPP